MVLSTAARRGSPTEALRTLNRLAGTRWGSAGRSNPLFRDPHRRSKEVDGKRRSDTIGSVGGVWVAAIAVTIMACSGSAGDVASSWGPAADSSIPLGAGDDDATAATSLAGRSTHPGSKSTTTIEDGSPPCPLTSPNGNVPPGEGPSTSSGFLGNGALWTDLGPDQGKVLARPDWVHPDGSISVKFGWWRAVEGRLAIEGRRIDTTSPPLQSHIPSGYGDFGFQASSINFPTDGCWEVTGTVVEVVSGDVAATLTFVVLVQIQET